MLDQFESINSNDPSTLLGKRERNDEDSAEPDENYFTKLRSISKFILSFTFIENSIRLDKEEERKRINEE